MTAQTAPGRTKFGLYVITVVLADGYQLDRQYFAQAGTTQGCQGLSTVVAKR